jgi:hypothetical protein
LIWRSLPCNPAQHDLDPGQQHILIKGLGDVILGPQLEAQHLVQFPSPGGQKDDRYPALIVEGT